MWLKEPAAVPLLPNSALSTGKTKPGQNHDTARPAPAKAGHTEVWGNTATFWNSVLHPTRHPPGRLLGIQSNVELQQDAAAERQAIYRSGLGEAANVTWVVMRNPDPRFKCFTAHKDDIEICGEPLHFICEAENKLNNDPGEIIVSKCHKVFHKIALMCNTHWK